MIHFKYCPQCLTGDLEEKSDQDGHYLRCIQCGKHLVPLVLPANESASKRAGLRTLIAALPIADVVSAGGIKKTLYCQRNSNPGGEVITRSTDKHDIKSNATQLLPN